MTRRAWLAVLFLIVVLALTACGRLPLPVNDEPIPGVDLSDPDVGGGAGQETGPQTPVPPATETREPSPRLDATAAAGLPTAEPSPTRPPNPTRPAPTIEPPVTATTAVATETPPPTAEPPATTPQPSLSPTGEMESSSETIHTVQPGENLYRIGLQYGLSWVVIAEYNGITDPNAIVVGQELRIPPQAASPTPEVESSLPTTDDGQQTTDEATPVARQQTADGGEQTTEAMTEGGSVGDAPEATAVAEPTDAPAVIAAPVVAATADAPAPSESLEDTHTVAIGDTLYNISRRYGISWAQVAEANGLATPNQIYAGQVLKIPVDAPGPTPEFAHRVHSGDTLARIARQYGLSPAALAQANGLTAPYVIYPGQELTIPGE